MGGRVEGEAETKATGRAMSENGSWKCVCTPELEVDLYRSPSASLLPAV